MTTFSDAFTQGGQTQLHKYRMMKQVVGATLKISLWMMLISFCLLLCFYKPYHKWQDFWFLLAYAKAWYMSICPDTIQKAFPTSLIYNYDGSEHYVRDYEIINSNWLNYKLQVIISSLIKKFMISIGIGMIGSILVSWFWNFMGKNKQKTRVISGFELVKPNILKKQVKKFGASNYHIGDIPLPKKAEFQHTMITGTTGAGKSNLFHHLLKQIRAQGDQAIIIDTTGGIFSRFYDEKKDILLNPLDSRTKNWNIWNEAKANYTIDEISESLVEQTSSYDSFWTQSARQLLSESIRYLTLNNKKSYSQLLNMSLQIPLKDLQMRLLGSSVASVMDPASEKTALSVRATLANSLRCFNELEDDLDNGISFLDLLEKDHKSWLFLMCNPDQREFVKPLFSAWVSLIIKGIMKREENNGSRTWIIIDELASLNKIPSLLLGLAEIRKYGGCFVLGFQDLNQLEKIYGDKETKTLSNLTGTKALFRCVDTSVAKRVASYLGEQEKHEASESISYGAHQMRDGVNLSTSTQIKPTVSASDVMMLKDLEAFLKLPGNFGITKIKMDYLNIPNINKGFVSKNNILKKSAMPILTSNIIPLNKEEHELNPESEIADQMLLDSPKEKRDALSL